MIQRVQTGIDGLDQLLCGGFMPGDAALILGAPGTGKTSLGMQFIFNGITRFNEPGVFITFEEFPQQIYRDAGSFGWDFRQLEADGRLKVVFTSPDLLVQDIQREEGLILEMIRETHARRAVVDSISYYEPLSREPGRFRETVYGLINALKREGLTSLLTSELITEPVHRAEEFLTDSVLLLTDEMVAGQRMRFIEVVKSRGSRHLPVRSLFHLGDRGIAVVPAYREPAFLLEEAVSTGIAQLDDLLGGGIPYGRFYLIEIDASLHQDLFDINFAREAIAAGDIYVQVSDAPAQMNEFLELADRSEAGGQVRQALERGQIHLIGPSGDGASSVLDQVRKIMSGADGQRIRLEVDLSRLRSLLDSDAAVALLNQLLDLGRREQAVALATINPSVVDSEALGRIRSAADGIIRVWAEGNYDYLQVTKTVNRVRTPVYSFREIAEPPFVEIIFP
jgi:circadian clock protein KaiC